MEEKKQREKKEAEKQQREEREKEEARRMETPKSQIEAVAKERPRSERSQSEMDIEGRGEAGTSQFQYRCKKGQMTNIYLTDSDEEAIVDFIKDYEELYNKTNKHLKEKARKDCLWKRFANSATSQ